MKRSRKMARELNRRIQAWEDTVKRGGDIVRKLGEKGFRKPGSRPGHSK